MDYGVDVKAVPVASGLERDQLMQSGAIDGMLNEMITTANFNRNRLQVKSVISARKAYPDYPLFRVLSAPGSSLTSTGGLAGVPIGISKNTIIIKALKNKAPAVRLFLKAWDRASAAINKDPESFRELLLKKIRVPKNIHKTYKIPPYPRREVPDAGQWADVMNWMTDKGLLASALPYDDSITADYLPPGN